MGANVPKPLSKSGHRNHVRSAEPGEDERRTINIEKMPLESHWNVKNPPSTGRESPNHHEATAIVRLASVCGCVNVPDTILSY